MPIKDLHEDPFDAATLAKLSVFFEDYAGMDSYVRHDE